MKDFLLSICIPTFNRAEIVFDCVQQCLRETPDWVEVVVNDNCSADNTIALLSSIKDERLKVYSNERNIGYENLMKCMTRGSGTFCLLLGDEDELVDVKWESVRHQLLNAEETSIFQFKYKDGNGNILVESPARVFKKDNCQTYKEILHHFGYAGAVVLKSEIIKRVWENAYKPAYLWSLYAEIIIPMYCAQYGNYAMLEDICAARTERSNIGELDVGAWKGKLSNEPYWTIKSRRKQNQEWIDFISNFTVEKKTKCELAQEIILKQLCDISDYYFILNLMVGIEKMPLFYKCWDIVERDRKITNKEWGKIFFESYNEIIHQYRLFFTERLPFGIYIKVFFLYVRLKRCVFFYKMPLAYITYRKARGFLTRRNG